MTNYAIFTSKEEYHRRYEICKTCDSFNDVLKLCLECACFMPAKCKLSESACPKNLWDTTDESFGEEPTDL